MDLTNHSLFLFPIIAGLVSSFTHCAGMCGPLQLGIQLHSMKSSAVVLFHVGRMTTYVILGTLGGLVGQVFHWNFSGFSSKWSFLILSILYLLIGLKLFIYRQSYLEKKIGPLFNAVSEKFRSKGGSNFYAGGLLTGLLPCPTTLAVLIWSLSAPHFLYGSFGMLVLGLFTLPSFGLLRLRAVKSFFSAKFANPVFIVLFLALAGWNLQKFYQDQSHLCGPHHNHQTKIENFIKSKFKTLFKSQNTTSNLELKNESF